MFYKMINGLTPAYLSQLVPQPVSAHVQYNLRNTQNLNVPFCRTNIYYNSFLPTVIREWNALPPEVKNADTLDMFKSRLKINKTNTPPHYYTGNRKAQILHTRLRNKCSALNEDLFSKGIVDTALCQCGLVESTHHFFFICRYYHNIRQVLFTNVSRLCDLTLNNFLFGDTSLSHETNADLFSAVQKFITESKRFLWESIPWRWVLFHCCSRFVVPIRCQSRKRIFMSICLFISLSFFLNFYSWLCFIVRLQRIPLLNLIIPITSTKLITANICKCKPQGKKLYKTTSLPF